MFVVTHESLGLHGSNMCVVEVGIIYNGVFGVYEGFVFDNTAGILQYSTIPIIQSLVVPFWIHSHANTLHGTAPVTEDQWSAIGVAFVPSPS